MNWKPFTTVRVVAASAVCLIIASGCKSKAEQPEPPTERRVASAQLLTSDGAPIDREVTFTERSDGMVTILAELRGLPPGEHGFHIHEGAGCAMPEFESAGGHFAPEDNPHGGPRDDSHHAGDLGNIEVDDSGTARVEITTRAITLDPDAESSIIGQTLILHAGADDLESQPAGDAGDRIACGVVRPSGPGVARARRGRVSQRTR